MSRAKWLALALVPLASFVAAYRVKSASRGRDSAPTEAPAPDSVRLAAAGVYPGRQLLAYVLVNSHCGFCRQSATKAALGKLRGRLRASAKGLYATTTVIAVASDKDLSEGLDYLKSIGLENFDEVDAGGGWINEAFVRLVWRGRMAKPGVPQVVLVSRSVSAHVTPFEVAFTTDTLLSVAAGSAYIVEWVDSGAPLKGLVAAPKDSVGSTLSPPDR